MLNAINQVEGNTAEDNIITDIRNLFRSDKKQF